MVEAIVYYSKCGHSLVYAKELSNKLNLPLYTIKKAKKVLPKKSSIIFISWLKEDKIMKYDSVLRFKIDSVCAVGIMANDEEKYINVKQKNQLYSKLFCLSGGINKKQLGFKNKISLKSIENELSFKLLDSGLKKSEARALDAILHNLDYVDLNELNQIINLYKEYNNFS